MSNNSHSVEFVSRCELHDRSGPERSLVDDLEYLTALPACCGDGLDEESATATNPDANPCLSRCAFALCEGDHAETPNLDVEEPGGLG